MILSACPTGICRCWCNATNNELLTHELALSWDESNIIHPQVAALLASNDVPPDSEVMICQSSIHTIDQDVEIIDAHIAHLQSIINGLQALRQKRVEDSRPYRKIINPAKRLPVEILSKIFRDACPPLRIEPMASGLDFESSINADRFPWTLTLVSSRWRQVALSTPRMWSTIIINLEVTSMHDNYKFVDHLEWTDAHSHLLALQLQRSRTSLLTVAIVTDSLLPLSHPLLLNLLPTSSRWERLAVHHENLPDLSPIQGNLSALHTLQLVGYASGSQPGFTHFSVAPKLHTVYTVVYLPLPFSQITEFATSGNVDFNILGKFVSVERCFLGGTLAVASPPTTLHFLRSLKLHFKIDNDRIFAPLTLPALEILDIKTIWLNPIPVVLLFKRSQCVLKELHIRCSGLYPLPSSVSGILKNAPSLEILTLEIDWFRDSLKELTEQPDFLPSLRLISIRASKSSDDILLCALKAARPGLGLVKVNDVGYSSRSLYD